MRLSAVVWSVAVLACAQVCHANGGPVEWTQGKASGGIVPRAQSGVELVREDLNIAIIDLNRYDVEARYLLRNRGPATRIKYGVPLYWVGEFNSKELASGIRIEVAGKGYSCTAVEAKPRPEEQQNEMIGTVGDAWCVAELEVPGGDVSLQLAYRADLEFEDSETSKSALRDFSKRALSYPLAPAGYWNGRPKLEVRVDLGPYAGRVSGVRPAGGTEKDGVLRWHLAAADLKAIGRLEMGFDAQALLKSRQLATWNARTEPTQRVRGAVKASSTLAPEARYRAANLLDGNPETAWCEGRPGDGVGESFTFELEPFKHEFYCGIEGFVFVPGYAKSQATWRDNGRVRRLRVEECENPSSFAVLRFQPADDVAESSLFAAVQNGLAPWQHVESAGGRLRKETAVEASQFRCLRVIILDVVPGRRFSDACISEFAIVRNCG